MNKSFFVIMAGILLSLAVFPAHGQTKKKLQDKKKKLQSEIKYTEKKIRETQDLKKNSIHQLEKINRNIEARSELIRTYETEIRSLENEIQSNQREVKKLNNSIESLKKSYAGMVYHAWLNRHNLNQSLFILASDNFNEAFRRARYFKQIGEMRKDRLQVIREAKLKKEKAVSQLQENKQSKTVALTEQTREANELQKVRNEKETVITSLKTKEKELLTKVEKKKKEAEQLTAKINAIIEKEIRDANKTAKTTTNTKTGTKTTNTNTKTTTVKETGNTEGGALTSGFESNKGRLPWPVEKGFISGKFGVQPHPVLSKVEIKNDGVDITTDKGSNVRAVYKGEVSGVFKVDGYENVVILRHGQYLTVYCHLSSVSVSKGAKVDTKQKVGTVATDDEGKTFVNFQVRNGATVLNPSLWLSR